MESNAIIIDNGSGVIKAGFSESEEPQLIFQNYVGKPKHKKVMTGGKLIESLAIGPKVDNFRGLLNLTRPMSHGAIENLPMEEAILRHVYSGLHASSEDHPLVITEPVLNTYKNRESLSELLYESFRVPSLYLATPGILSLFANAQSTGIVIDIGDGVTSCTPVSEGFAVSHAVSRMDVAGRDVTVRLEELLKRSGADLMASSAEREVIREVKEKVCYVRECATSEEDIARMFTCNRKDVDSPWGIYKLPDNSIINIGPERFMAPEILFQPKIIGNEGKGIHEMVIDSIQRTDVDLRSTLYENIILTGGTTLMAGLPERLFSEVRLLAPNDTKVRMCASPDRMISAWIGGSVVASLPTFNSLLLSKEEYEESGPSVLHTKFV